MSYASPLNEPKTPDFYLRLIDDAGYLVRNGEKMGKYRSPCERFDIAKGYKKGDLEFVLRFHIQGGRKVRNLVFTAIPMVGMDDASQRKFGDVDLVVGTLESDTGKEPVLPAVT